MVIIIIILIVVMGFVKVFAHCLVTPKRRPPHAATHLYTSTNVFSVAQNIYRPHHHHHHIIIVKYIVRGECRPFGWIVGGVLLLESACAYINKVRGMVGGGGTCARLSWVR